MGALTGIAPLSIDAYIPGLPELTSDLGTSASCGLGALVIHELWCDRGRSEPAFEPAP